MRLELAGHQIELDQMAEVLRLSVDDFATHARSLASPDELSVYIAKQLMRQLAPSLLWITLHDIDIAHSGTFSLYLDGHPSAPTGCARRSGRPSRRIPNTRARPPCSSCRISAAIPTSTPAATGSSITARAIAVSRTTWMMVLGPGVRQNVVVERRVEPTDLIPTLGEIFGFDARLSKASRWRRCCEPCCPANLTAGQFRRISAGGQAIGRQPGRAVADGCRSRFCRCCCAK